MRAKGQTRKVEGGRRKGDCALRTPKSALRLRSGLTLIELLVVIIILTTVLAAAIPILAPADDDRRLREATRTLNTFITGAQTRAIVLRRPFGVALKRLSQDTADKSKGGDPKRADPTNPENDNGVCVELFYVEQQPPYAGFDANSRARVALNDSTASDQAGTVLISFVTRGTTSNDPLPIGWDADLFPIETIRPNDVIEIGDTRFELLPHRYPSGSGVPVGQYYPFNWNKNGSGPVVIVARPMNDTGQLIIPKHDDDGIELGSKRPGQEYDRPYWTLPAPYKVLRQPTPTNDPPLQLPDGTAIDLRASGIGANDYFYVPDLHDNADSVLVMFAPEGRIQRVYFSQQPNFDEPFDSPVVDNIYLLVGKRENIPAPAVDDDVTLHATPWGNLKTEEERREVKAPINWLIGESRWVVIGPQSGRIASIENAFVEPTPAATSTMPLEAARNQQIIASREFTRAMAQMGGR